MTRRRGWRGRLASLGPLLGVSLAVTIFVYALRAAGFRFRWEEEADRTATAGTTTADTDLWSAAGSEPAAGPRSAAGVQDAASSLGRPAVSGSRPTAGPETLARGADEPSNGQGVIDFETYPDGTPACESCPLTDEYRSLGVLFSFRSWSADAQHPSLVDAASYLPEGAPGAHGVAPALHERGLEVGVVRMDFPGSPACVVFDLTGPDLIERFQVTAWTSGRRIDSLAILRSRARTFHAAGGGLFRQEVVTIESAGGIDRVELDGWGPPGYLMLIDNLKIGEGSILRRHPR